MANRTVDEIVKQIRDGGKDYEPIPTGLTNLDIALDGGFFKKEMVVIGGFTGSGKSYLAGQISLNMIENGYKVAYFSLEISAEMVVSRILGSLSNIKPMLILQGNLPDSDKELVDNAEGRLFKYSELLDVYDDIYDIDMIGDIVSKNKYDLVVIDFIQNVFRKAKGEEYERMSYVSLYLQRLAKKTESCILALSQLSNSASKSGVVEYKGSGGIAMVCDLGFFLEPKDKKPILKLKKNRRGMSGLEFEIVFTTPGGRIYEKKYSK